jgi:diguanylate cyclase (GGDEF)-like protein/PAS domain S-box-containing protein
MRAVIDGTLLRPVDGAGRTPLPGEGLGRDARARAAESEGGAVDRVGKENDMDASTAEEVDAEPPAEGPVVHMTRSGVGVIQSVDGSSEDLLGWSPEQMIGFSSTKFIHPDDQPSAIAAWVKMIDSSDGAGVWRGRYQSARGTWVWVETVNQYGGAGSPIVTTTMTGVTAEQASMEERLYARGQLLSRLSDALPVGVFQVNLTGHVTFTNDRLHVIAGVGLRPTIAEQMSSIVDEDRPLFDAALAKAFADRAVEDIELRLRLPVVEGDMTDATNATKDRGKSDGERVCLLGLRTLTDSTGVVSGAVGCLSDVTEGAQLRRELEVRASIDALTSCLNRAATLELVGRTIATPAGGGGNAVVFIDLDRFKAVNDHLGHAAGDRLLVEVADRLRGTLRDGDHVGRFGGDEFLVICPGVDSAVQAREIAERIAIVLTSTVAIGSRQVQLRASVGVAWTTQTLEADTLIAWADSAMYESKRLGLPAVTLFTGPGGGGGGGTFPVAV